MSAKRTTSSRKLTKPVLGTCRECIHSHTPHERDYKGDPFLCKCHADEGTWYEPYSRFLDKACENGKFKIKNQ